MHRISFSNQIGKNIKFNLKKSKEGILNVSLLVEEASLEIFCNLTQLVTSRLKHRRKDKCSLGCIFNCKFI